MSYLFYGGVRKLPLGHDRPDRPRVVFLLMLLRALTAKLILVGGNEIISMPKDSVNFLRQADTYLREIGGPMGYSYWLALMIRTIGGAKRLART